MPKKIRLLSKQTNIIHEVSQVAYDRIVAGGRKRLYILLPDEDVVVTSFAKEAECDGQDVLVEVFREESGLSWQDANNFRIDLDAPIVIEKPKRVRKKKTDDTSK